MDSPTKKAQSQISIRHQNENPLQFTIHLPNSANPNSNSTVNSSPNPDFGQTSSSSDALGQDHFLSVPIPKKRRRGRPRNSESSVNQVKSVSSPPNNSTFRDVRVSAGFSSSGQVVENSRNLTWKKHGSSASSSSSSGVVKRSVDDMSDEIIVINKEATNEALIALTAGFPADSLTEEEVEYGVVSDVGGIEQVNYILIRNHIITRWRENVRRWLTKEMFVDVVPKHCGALLDTAYNYLVAYGYINFGVAPGIKEKILVEPSKPKVIVIGAGLAGLGAARQLMAFGFKVVVLEGRKRAGGRVYTMKLESAPTKKFGFADLGGSILTGTLGNPLGILARQLSFKLHKVRDKCPLYRADGSPVDPELDQKVERDFNELLDMVSRHRKMMGEVSQDISLGSALETFRHPFSKEEMNLFNWHLANLEYANAGLLSKLSLAFWDQDDPYDMGGDHCFLHGGNGRLIQALVENVPILYEKTVESIRYGSDGVQVTAGDQVYEGDMVLCTVPLGVLKSGSIKFHPELPQRKLDGIKRLGFGLLNKVVMLFSHAFWGIDLDTFGHLSDDPSHRGEFFLFYSYATVAGGAILIALVAGEAASWFEAIEASAAVTRVLKVLRDIYEPQGINVPTPLQAACSRWGSDPLSCGSYSNVAVGASGDDYDILAESVGDGRLFFAGEATNRRYPATMHGALLSGFREAANMAHYAKVRASGSKIEKNPSKNAHDCASILADLFRTPDVEFGGFAVIFGRKKSDSMAILRVTFGGQQKKQNQQYSNKLLFEQLQSHFNQQHELHVYALLSKQQAMELREVRGGDEVRLNYLHEKLGVKLVGRKGLGPYADSIIDSVKAERSRSRRKALTAGGFSRQQSQSKFKAPSTKQKLIRKAQILRKGNIYSVRGPNVGNEVSYGSNNVGSRTSDNSCGLINPSSDIEVRATSSCGDVAPPNSHGSKFMNDIAGSVSQDSGRDLSTCGSNIETTSLNNNSTLSPPDSNVGTASGGYTGGRSDIVTTSLSNNSIPCPPDPNVGSALEDYTRGSTPQHFAITSSFTPAIPNDGVTGLSTNKCVPSPSLTNNMELVGGIRNEEVLNFENNSCSIAPQSSEVGVLSSDTSLTDLHISSFVSQGYGADISDGLSSIAIQENIFEDIMNELLPPSSTDSHTWHFNEKL